MLIGVLFSPMGSRAVTSFSMSENAWPSAARKQTEPTPVGTNSVAACSVMTAEGSANNSSRLGGTGLVRPSRASRNPTAASLPAATAAELLGDLLQRPKTLLERRGRVGQPRERPSPPTPSTNP